MKYPSFATFWLTLSTLFLSSCYHQYGAGNFTSLVGYVAKPIKSKDSSNQAVYLSGSIGTNFGHGYTKRERSTYGSFMAHYAQSFDYFSIAAGASGYMGKYCMINNMYPRGSYNYSGVSTFFDVSYDKPSSTGIWRILSLRLGLNYENGDYHRLRKRLVEENYLFRNISERPISSYVGLNTEVLLFTKSSFSYGFRLGGGIWWNNQNPIFFQYNPSLFAHYKKFGLTLDAVNQPRNYDVGRLGITGGQIQLNYRF